MCLNHDFYFFWVSSLAYPNLLGKKGYVVVVVVVVVVIVVVKSLSVFNCLVDSDVPTGIYFHCSTIDIQLRMCGSFPFSYLSFISHLPGTHNVRVIMYYRFFCVCVIRDHIVSGLQT